MLLFAVCLFFITQASDLDYDDLVSNVEDTLAECSDIVDNVGNYVEQVHALDGLRRRATNVKLGACKKIQEAVDKYRVKHNRQVMIQSFTKWPGNTALNVLLNRVGRKMGNILYIASRDGDDISLFHKACDNQGPTLVVVQSTIGAIFGGYTDVSWQNSGGFKRSSSSFLFRIYPTVEFYGMREGEESYAVMHRADTLMFGAGGQLYIASKCLNNFKSFVGGYNTYNTPGDRSLLNNGQKYFKVLDYFVVKAIYA